MRPAFTRYASARTIFFSRPDLQRYAFSGSYQRLARELATWSGRPENDRCELFKRLVFNCLVSNTDDHELNHGLVDTGRGFVLSPLFDVVPQLSGTRRQYLKLVAGDLGHEASRENLLSDPGPFGLSPSQAATIIDAMQVTVSQQWEACLARRGVTARLREKMRPAFCPAGFSTIA